jgi:co-chaperonin GroES (HSP10)
MKIPEEEKIEYLTPEDLKVRPVDKMLFIALDPKHEKIGKIQLSDKQRQVTRVGTILAMGPNVDVKRYGYKIGEKVLMEYWAGKNINLPKYKIFEGTHKMVPENEIWSFIDE